MAIPIYRLLACVIPLQAAAMLAFAWSASRPPSSRPLTSPAAPAAQAPEVHADRILVVKSEHSLTLFAHGAVLRSYKVALGRASGPKQQQGDNRTPEGHYRIVGHNAHSSCHRALLISYPNADDRAHHRTGGDVEIHGLPNGFGYIGSLHRSTDWTYGCIAVTDAEMDEIYRLVPDNTPIDIQP
jgi:murein L,D-transpeptidase YafK